MLHTEKQEKRSLFFIWAIVVLVANLVFSYADAFQGDQSFWVSWVKQLQKGFDAYRGDYPPLYLLWLRVVAGFYSFSGIFVENNYFLKFFCLWPVFFSHLLFLHLVVHELSLKSWGKNRKHLLCAFVALNPVFLLDGPVWGQIDLFPVTLAVLAIWCEMSSRRILFGPLFYVLALLSKFQMIMFLPIFGGLFLRRWQTSWKGLPFAFLGTALVLFPFILAGNLGITLENAYIKTLSSYPYGSMNAGNIWMLIQGNMAGHLFPLVDFGEGVLKKIFTPSFLGKTLFILFSLWTLYQIIRKSNKNNVFLFAALNAYAFFIFLPGMHERYIFSAVPMILMWTAYRFKGIYLSLFLTAIAFLNIGMVHSIRGNDFWPYLSFFTIMGLLCVVISILFPRFFIRLINIHFWGKIPVFVPYLILILVLSFNVGNNYYHIKVNRYQLKKNEIWLYDLPRKQFSQSYKSPVLNRSVEGNVLRANRKTYDYGIGTHAPSKLVYTLPENAKWFKFGAAIDDEAKPGNVKVRIRLENVIVFESDVLTYGKELWDSVNVDGKRQITLETDPNGSDFCDHVDWLQPIIVLKN